MPPPAPPIAAVAGQNTFANLISMVLPLLPTVMPGAEALAPGPPDVGGVPPAHAVLTSKAAPKIAISRLMSLSPRSLRSPMYRPTCLNYVAARAPVRFGREPIRSDHGRFAYRRAVHRAVALVCASAVAFGVTYADHAPLIPLIAADFGLDDLHSGLLSTGLFAVYLVFTLVG